MFEKENEIEKYLRVETEKLGGMARKFVSPGWKGCPDRLLLLPGAMVVFVETKKPGEGGRRLQKHRQKELQELGFFSFIVDTKEAAAAVINGIKLRRLMMGADKHGKR